MGIRQHFSRFALIVALLFSLSVQAQDGGYIIHEVQQGETLFGISRQYDVKIRDIKKYNPDLRSPLSVGEKIVIPKRKIKPDTDSDPGYFEYEVKAKETLYSLAKRFEVSIGQLYRLNEGLKENGLKEGMMLKVPFTNIDNKPDEEQSEDKAPDNSTIDSEDPNLEPPTELLIDSLERIVDDLPEPKAKGAKYQMAVLLPLHLDINDSLLARSSDSLDIYVESEIALSYLMGLKLALDSLEKAGLDMKVHIFDTANDSLTIQELIKNPVWADIDFCIGPLFSKNIEWVAPHLNLMNIPLISPFSRSSLLAKRFRNIWQCFPGYRQEASLMARYSGFSVGEADRLVLVYQSNGEDLELVELMKKNFINRDRDTLKPIEWTYEQDYIKTMNPKELPHDTGMVFILASTNPAFVTDFLNKLGKYDYMKPKVVAFSVVEKIKGFDPFVMDQLGVRFPRYDFTADSAQYNNFQRVYRKKYSENANGYAMLGFDQMHFFGKVFVHKKGNLNSVIGKRPEVKTHSGYRFFGKMNTSKINQLLFMVEYKDFNLVRITE